MFLFMRCSVSHISIAMFLLYFFNFADLTKIIECGELVINYTL